MRQRTTLYPPPPKKRFSGKTLVFFFRELLGDSVVSLLITRLTTTPGSTNA